MPSREEKRKEMFSMIESWKASGESQHAFCKARGTVYSGFHYWMKKYREQMSTPSPSDFIKLNLPDTHKLLPVAELVMPDGKLLRFYQAVDASLLRALLV
ncbi:MAG: hypothetical protein ABI477_19980 [Chryseolinea sp.]